MYLSSHDSWAEDHQGAINQVCPETDVAYSTSLSASVLLSHLTVFQHYEISATSMKSFLILPELKAKLSYLGNTLKWLVITSGSETLPHLLRSWEWGSKPSRWAGPKRLHVSPHLGVCQAGRGTEILVECGRSDYRKPVPGKENDTLLRHDTL